MTSIPEHNLSIEAAVENLVARLDELFPDEYFEEESLYLIQHGLFQCLRWSNLQEARIRVEKGDFVEPLNIIYTVNHFETEYVSRREIIDCIMHTSGLEEAVSEHALTWIEQMVDRYLPTYAVNLDFIGRIEQSNPPGYKIELATSLTVIPSRAKARPARARTASSA